MLARAQRDDERLVRDLIDAVADAMPRQPPVEVPRTPGGRAARAVVRGAAPGAARQAPAGRPDRPAAAGAALDPGRGRRGGAGRGRRTTGAAGARRAEPAAPLRPGDAVDRRRRRARLRRPGAHPRARSRCAPRPTRGRCSTGCSSCGCPTSSPSTPTSWSACSTTGVGALRERGVDVLWPRSLGRDLSATATLDRARADRAARGAAQRAAARAPRRCSPSSGRSRCTATR